MRGFTLLLTVGLLLAFMAGTGVAQDQSAPDKLAKLFKDHINKANTAGMKTVIMDIDNPNIVLQPQNYDRMENTMLTFIEAWKGKPFKLYDITAKGSLDGIVYMWSAETLNQIKFYVTRIRVGKDWKWFIRDFEVFENITQIGKEGEDIG
jgi:hypothetical protein